MVVVIIVDPPGDPITKDGLPFLRTMVGVIELKGRLPGCIEFASLPIRSKAFG